MASPLTSTALSQVETLEAGQSLYHYTTAAVLPSIVGNNEFWVTHSDFLNDYSEVSYIEDVAKSVVERLVESPLLATRLHAGLMAEFARIRTSYRQLYILSFSLEPDGLILWSEFSDGYGYLLELDVEQFRSHLPESWGAVRQIEEGRVIYDRAKQEEILAEEVLTPWLGTEPITTAQQVDDLMPLLPGIAMSVYEYAPFFKGASFAFENEYRFVFYCTEKCPDGSAPCNFRTRGEMIIPFIKVSLAGKDGRGPALRGVVVGPKNKSDLAVHGVNYLLHSNGHTGVTVKKSQVTLRY